ncbi:PREDICTED: two-component response regulator ARR22-like [Camelina sativa]|uniref:Two-component response regulator ARR22-like n=1 Tax=Camelina sativa TaxID=90675 RepID=A0ABM0WAC1_CAMSA|nr:PREDICTED: two-component response regulator ARR22-like [Camelina sativa]
MKKNMSLIYKKKLTVLIVDEDPYRCGAYMGIIQMAGGFPYMARNAEEAVNLHLNGDYYNLIIMDMNDMSLIDGVPLIKKLRDMKVTSMIVGVTSHEDENRAFMNAGVDHCLVKPLTFGKMDPIINQLKSL